MCGLGGVLRYLQLLHSLLSAGQCCCGITKQQQSYSKQGDSNNRTTPCAPQTALCTEKRGKAIIGARTHTATFIYLAFVLYFRLHHIICMYVCSDYTPTTAVLSVLSVLCCTVILHNM